MYEYPKNPADSNADEVEAWLKTNPPVEQRNDVLAAEASETGKNRKTILAYASSDPTPPANPDANPGDPNPPGQAPEPGGTPSENPPTQEPPTQAGEDEKPEGQQLAEALQTSDKPVWYEETQGKVDPAKADLYRVIPDKTREPVG